MWGAKGKQCAEANGSGERMPGGKRRRSAEEPRFRDGGRARARLRYQHQKAEQALLGLPPVRKKRSMSEVEYNLWRKYRLTQADYDRMVAMQNGLCAICERRPQAKLCVGHCPATHRLRFPL